MRLEPPPGFKRVSDWRGKHVRSCSVFSNYLGSMPAGSLFVVTSAGRTGLHLAAVACHCCGFRFTVSHISHDAVRLDSAPHDGQPNQGGTADALR